MFFESIIEGVEAFFRWCLTWTRVELAFYSGVGLAIAYLATYLRVRHNNFMQNKGNPKDTEEKGDAQ